jgi:hypothetical protein
MRGGNEVRFGFVAEVGALEDVEEGGEDEGRTAAILGKIDTRPRVSTQQCLA